MSIPMDSRTRFWEPGLWEYFTTSTTASMGDVHPSPACGEENWRKCKCLTRGNVARQVTRTCKIMGKH